MSEEKEPITAKTAFMVIQNENGMYYAVNDLESPINVQFKASVQDIKIGCREIVDAVARTDMYNLINAVLAQNPQETVSSSIREALDERGIL